VYFSFCWRPFGIVPSFLSSDGCPSFLGLVLRFLRYPFLYSLRIFDAYCLGLFPYADCPLSFVPFFVLVDLIQCPPLTKLLPDSCFYGGFEKFTCAESSCFFSFVNSPTNVEKYLLAINFSREIKGLPWIL
jgi:hypothetical protein